MNQQITEVICYICYFTPLTPYTHYLHVLKRAAGTEITAQTEKITHRAGDFVKVQM